LDAALEGTVTLSVELAEPPEVRVMFSGVSETWNPENEATVRLTFPENPSMLVAVMIVVAEPPAGMIRKF